MNDKITISTAQLFTMIPDQETARTSAQQDSEQVIYIIPNPKSG